jgi:hypothetical protein
MPGYSADRSMGAPDPNAGEDPFDPVQYYRNLEECYKLQVLPEEVDWETTATRRTGTAPVILNLSCAIQATPHLMLTQVALFKTLGIDFVATSGTQFCCGRPFGMSGDVTKGDRVAWHTIDRMATWNSTTNVQQCGSCLLQFRYNVEQMREQTGSAPWDEVVHITDFVLQRLKEMGDSIPWADPKPTGTRRFLLHAEGLELHPTKLEARHAVIETLGMIPGVEFAGLVTPPSVGQPCDSDSRPELKDAFGHTLLSDITTDAYRQAQAELLAQAEAVGAEGILTLHHRCQREWGKFSSPKLPIMHYHSLLLEALGTTVPDRFRRLWQMEADEILVETRPYWQAWGLDEAEAKRLVTKFFVPEYERNVRYCACDLDGSCFAAELRRVSDMDSVCAQHAPAPEQFGQSLGPGRSGQSAGSVGPGSGGPLPRPVRAKDGS